MTTVNKEAIYDDLISPLMAQIIAICKEHKLAMVASFHCENPDDEDSKDLVCTTALTADDFEPPARFKQCLNVLYGRPPVPGFRITTTSPDGSKSVEDHRFI
ncbi:hypothetical protein [Cupriavidus campinensis]|uniref:Uncharacterized protein n=1 Tax=Cupriavidus campinensis TaxID=151783 RepID=A0ABY3EST7_9BURK|nr:hypothetical protein [Cupriavidus campinensis]TSP14027.1 hypothetical protein FGG12_06030 [Cupriavidus campinensis]